jgi:DAK2 domain fusion protein YloV
VTDLERARALARSALAAIEASRRRIDDLNVYPVPDGDTGTNLALTVRAVVDGLEESTAVERSAVAHDLARAALMGARGNSGVILSQIVRGACDVLAVSPAADAVTIAGAFRGASDAAYRAVRRPVEGTMLTVIRELAQGAEESDAGTPAELLLAVVERGEDAVARTTEQLDVLREAGVVDAGGAGLLEIVRGVTVAVTGEALPEPAPLEHELGVEAVHRELSQYRYCTVFLLEGDALDADALESRLESIGDSLLVVGDESALKIHVHTDDPGAALSMAVAAGTIDRVEINDMHRQTRKRSERLADALAPASETKTCEAVAVVAGEGNRRLFESLGAGRIVEGGQSMNPSAQEILAAIESSPAGEVVVLPNNDNVILTAEQAARLASKPVRVVQSDSLPAGLAAMVVYDPDRSAEANVADMHEALASVATGAVTIASRDADVDGISVAKGAYLGLVDDEAVASGASFDDVARAVVERLLAEPRDLLTLLTGEHEPDLDALRGYLEAEHPALELEIQPGGQPHYPLLLSAE